MKTIFVLPLFIASVFGTSVGAAETPFIAPSDRVDAERLIGPAERPGTETYRTEMAIVLWLQKTRTPEQVAFVDKPLDLGRFVPVLGADLLEIDGEALASLIDEIIDEVRDDYDQVKARYDVARPFVANPEVKHVGEARPVSSYPSGHAIRAVVMARILAECFPSRRDDLMTLAEQVGYGRVIAGVHFPMDIVAGQKLGNAYADAIIGGERFRKAFAALGRPPNE